MNGEYEAALIRYEKAAEWGYEVAQANAALMYDSGLGIANNTNSTRYQLAFEYFRNSAEQKSSESLLKIGDYYYFGLGTPQSYEKAAMYYQSAGEMRSAQAIWNLGYMHQHGIGLPKDLHLAKRHFDHALAIDKDSWLAVYIALIGLGYDFAVQWFESPNSSPIVDVEWDTIMIIVLGGILSVLVIIRQAALLARQRPVVQ
jgi:SEL1 protein